MKDLEDITIYNETPNKGKIFILGGEMMINKTCICKLFAYTPTLLLYSNNLDMKEVGKTLIGDVSYEL